MNRRAALYAVVTVVLLTGAAFYPVLQNDFVTYDDPLYVTANAHVRTGVSGANILWAFTTGHAANWHPVTWLSHLVDYSLFGMHPAGHHLTNLLIHAANALLLYLFLSYATGAPGCSLVVAALFAVHPLRVESVAWVAERKDVLSGLFGIAALWAYTAYARRPSRSRYLASFTLFALGLLAKPMLVTLPFALLLLDFWPLGRKAARMLLIEKVPFLAAAFASAAVTLYVQARGGAVGSFDRFPVPVRVANAADAYVAYLTKTFVPRHLAVLYPHPGATISFAWAGGAALLLITGTVLILALRRRYPYLVTGWFWFGMMLAPVIGIVQIGDQAYADRYTYLPSIGLAIAVVWMAAALVRALPGRALLAVAAIIPCVYLTHQQTQVWHDTESLFRHTVAVTRPNKVAHMKLGCVLLQRGQLDAAAGEFDAALRIDPYYAEAMGNRGMVLLSQGNLEDARQAFETALQWQTRSVTVRANLGIVLFQQRHPEEAFRVWDEALRMEPDNPDVHCNRGTAFLQTGRYSEAEEDLAAAFRARPWDAQGAYALGVAMLQQGKKEPARDMLQRVLALEPHHALAARALEALGGSTPAR